MTTPNPREPHQPAVTAVLRRLVPWLVTAAVVGAVVAAALLITR